MTNHDMLAFIYENGPCTHIDIDFEFGCGCSKATFVGIELMHSDLLDYDPELGLFSYAGESWVAQP